MKYYGSILDFTTERNNELMRIFRQHLSQAPYIIMPQIFYQVAHSPCSRFWVSEERAAVVISYMLAGKKFKNMRPNKRAMFHEIFRRFLMLRRQYPQKSIYDLAIRVVHQPAPSFYMTPRTVGEIIYRIKSGYYAKHGNNNKRAYPISE